MLNSNTSTQTHRYTHHGRGERNEMLVFMVPKHIAATLKPEICANAFYHLCRRFDDKRRCCRHCRLSVGTRQRQRHGPVHTHTTTKCIVHTKQHGRNFVKYANVVLPQFRRMPNHTECQFCVYVVWLFFVLNKFVVILKYLHVIHQEF